MYGLPAAGGEGGGVGDIPASLEDIMASAGVAHAGSEDATAGTDIEGTYEYGYMRAPNRARGGHRTDYGIGSYYGAWCNTLDNADRSLLPASITEYLSCRNLRTSSIVC